MLRSTPFPEFSTVYTLGVGTFSTVNLAEHHTAKVQMAVKVASGSPPFRSSSEVEIMHSLDFPFICRLFEAVETPDATFLAVEYAAGGTLLNFIARHGPLRDTGIRKLAGELLLALTYLHIDRRIMHMDVKIENILLDCNNTVRLADFGFSTFFDAGRQSCGSAPYVAPEVIRGEKPGFEADIWSFGIVLYCISVGQFPFYDPSLPALLHKIEPYAPLYPTDLNPALTVLIQRMLRKNPSDRISLKEIREHAFLAEFDFALVEAVLAMPKPASEGDGLVAKIRARDAEMARYAAFAIVEKSDEHKSAQVGLDRRLATLRPFSEGVTEDPMRRLALRVAGVKRAKRPSF
jgi:serine/threonine-protein kinase SIK3